MKVFPPLGLTDSQLAAVMAAASAVPVGERDTFLQFIAVQLKIKTVDVNDSIRRALLNLNHVNAANK